MGDTPELDQIVVRRAKLAAIKAAGIDPYPATVKRTATAAQAVRQADSSAPEAVWLVGRVRARRDHGASTFLTLEDGSGRIQLYLKKDVLGDEYDRWLQWLDLGDFVEVSGEPFRTKTNEPSLKVAQMRIVGKSLQPLPEQWHGLSDIEIRYRQRELDLLANSDIRLTFERRAKLISALRRYLDDHHFLEVETPMLQPIAGGTIATPFVTHHEALNHDFYLRIAPELYLKRLIVGGFERVYEIGRNFRNEGIDHTHNPEFTMAELYVAYADYQWLMQFTEELLSVVVREVVGKHEIMLDGTSISFAPPFTKIRFEDALRDATGLDFSADDKALKAALKKHGVKVEKKATAGKLFDALFKAVVSPKLVQPTFVIDHPLALSPLAKQHPDKPDSVQRFQLIVAGAEIINAYSELNDPDEQRQRFEATSDARHKGDTEAHPFDPDFIRSLEIGLPPTAGWGLGIDRLAMLLSGTKAIKEVLFFPTLRPKSSHD